MPAIAARPCPFASESARTAAVMIDMHRAFIEPGSFGATLGNDVSLLAAVAPTAARLFDACRAASVPAVKMRKVDDALRLHPGF